MAYHPPPGIHHPRQPPSFIAPDPAHGVTRLEIPTFGPFTFDLLTGTPFAEKFGSRKRFATPYPELRGAVMLTLRLTF